MGALDIVPRDWTAGEVVTAAMLNAEVRDKWLAIQGQWQTFTPTVYTAAATTPTPVAFTNNLARYTVIGKTVIAQVNVKVNATTTGGCAVLLPPILPRDRLYVGGSLALFGTSTPTDQSGMAMMTADKTKLVVAAFSGGYRDATSGHDLRYSVTYEAA
jgi:hypothetical protein